MTGQATGAGVATPPAVDQVLLTDLERWRSAIARNVALRNPTITQGELNAFVHGIVDRILYLRLCEDRGFLPAGTLRNLAPAAGILERFSALFLDAEGSFPLGLYRCIQEGDRPPASPPPQEPQLDDRVLRGIIEEFSSSDNPYNFSVLSPLQLAEVFRKFLRMEIRPGEGHRAVLDERAEVKGAGGFLPPPETAREYLVAHTLEGLVQGRSPDGIARLRILDLACGSGSLLLRAYLFLRDRYLKEGDSFDSPTLEDRFRILGSLFGVDPDPRAVEVTRLLLLSKALEVERGPEPLRSSSNLRDRCRELGRNIRCGNALIGPEYLEETLPHPSTRRAGQQVRPVDWAEAFPGVMEGGGFDAVIAEPPTHHPGKGKRIQEYLQQYYQAYDADADMPVYLIERGISLAHRNGIFASLTPDRWLRARYGRSLRRMLSTLQMEEIMLIREPSVHKEGAGETGHCILCVSPRPAVHGVRVIRADAGALAGMDASHPPRSRIVDATTLGDRGWTFVDRGSQALGERLHRTCTPLGRYLMGTPTRGDPACPADRFLVDRGTRDRMIRKDAGGRLRFRPVVSAEQIGRYAPIEPVRYLPVKHGQGISRGLGESRGVPLMTSGVILCAGINRIPVCTLDTSDALADERVLVISRGDHYLLGLLNSTLAEFLFRELAYGRRPPMAGLSPESLARFPVYVPDFSDPDDTARHDRMVALVTRMLELHKRMQESTLEHEQNIIQRQIEATDREIDALVYELYGLTEEERRIVEEATG